MEICKLSQVNKLKNIFKDVTSKKYLERFPELRKTIHVNKAFCKMKLGQSILIKNICMNANR